MTYLTGKVALDITAGAPNNGRGENNAGVVKKLRVGRNVTRTCPPRRSAGGYGSPFRPASCGPR